MDTYYKNTHEWWSIKHENLLPHSIVEEYNIFDYFIYYPDEIKIKDQYKIDTPGKEIKKIWNNKEIDNISTKDKNFMDISTKEIEKIWNIPCTFYT